MKSRLLTTDFQQPSFDLLFVRLGNVIEEKRRQAAQTHCLQLSETPIEKTRKNPSWRAMTGYLVRRTMASSDLSVLLVVRLRGGLGGTS
jgi:hypothetical protein